MLRFVPFVLAVGVLSACSAPKGEVACADLCDQRIFTCGSPESEQSCMWLCLAGVEHRNHIGRRCGKQHRREVACLAKVNDCEFLLEEDSYRRGDPCAERGTARANACEERGVPADELVPLDFDLTPQSFDASDFEAYDDDDLEGDEDTTPELAEGETLSRSI
ncbi:MAG: hypothetical protein H6724_19300 [Sandaracinus sp.]|nr:hypothetical protein [Myxococcales bacterium]MCB9602653.1 hypothetical protein [Sandaracinus sp.]MCB9621589.1 hypothetical protein [Sandaracinus sp.]